MHILRRPWLCGILLDIFAGPFCSLDFDRKCTELTQIVDIVLQLKGFFQKKIILLWNFHDSWHFAKTSYYFTFSLVRCVWKMCDHGRLSPIGNGATGRLLSHSGIVCKSLEPLENFAVFTFLTFYFNFSFAHVCLCTVLQRIQLMSIKTNFLF